jgi:hypothetical protein
MDEVRLLLERQARWQKTRKDLSWPEKIRMAEKIRESASQWRARDHDSTYAQSDSHRPSGPDEEASGGTPVCTP